MSHLDMNREFFYGMAWTGLYMPIHQWVGWREFQACYTMGGEL